MKEVAPSHGVVRFSAFEVDFSKGEVRKHGFRIRLQNQPFHVLQILLEHPGELVTREDLQRQIWPADTFVDFEKGLNSAIRKLRDALGDSAEQPRFIETHAKRGYCFIGSLEGFNGHSLTETALPTVVTPATSRSRYRALSLTVIVLLLAAGSVFGLDIGGLRSRLLLKLYPPTIHSIAVLPLQNLSADPAQEYFSDGMTDALITDLAQISSVKVISRTSSMQYKQTKKSLPEIAGELNVDGIIEGTVQRSGDRVRITAQLIYCPADKHLWASSYERDLRDVLTLERDVTEDIAHQVQAQLTTGHQSLPPQPRPVDLKVLDAYLQGNYHMNRADTGLRDEDLRKAGEFFQRAIDADPNFAPAYIGLAEAHHDLWWASSEDLALMRGAAEKAVSLDPNSSDARDELGLAKQEDWDWSGAEEEYRRAIALNPNSASGHALLGGVLDTLGRLEEGWQEINIAQQLDPNADDLSETLRLRGQFDRAVDLLEKMSERRPEDAAVRWELSESYLRKGLYREWVEELGKSMTLFGFPKISSNLHRAFEKSGPQGALRQWAGELERLATNKQAYFPGVLAETYAALGDKDRAFYWLGEGCDHRRLAISDPVLTKVKVDPGFAPLRSDPRFNDILRRMGLPQ